MLPVVGRVARGADSAPWSDTTLPVVGRVARGAHGAPGASGPQPRRSARPWRNRRRGYRGATAPRTHQARTRLPSTPPFRSEAPARPPPRKDRRVRRTLAAEPCRRHRAHHIAKPPPAQARSTGRGTSDRPFQRASRPPPRPDALAQPEHERPTRTRKLRPSVRSLHNTAHMQGNTSLLRCRRQIAESPGSAGLWERGNHTWGESPAGAGVAQLFQREPVS